MTRVDVGVDDEIIQYNNVLRTDPLCVYRRGEGGVEGKRNPNFNRICYKLHSRFLRFR